jgi:flagellar hook-associated protein 3 FlgL
MTTVGANFVSTHYLANSLVAPVMQAQSQLTSAITEESTGEYANLGLQLGDQSGYELSLKEQVGELQTLTSGNSLVSTSLSTAQNALSAIQASAQTTLDNLAAWTQGSDSNASLQDMGQSGLQSLVSGINTTSGDQYVFGGINSAVAPMADYYSTPTSAAKTAIDQAFQTTFGVLPTDPAAANISASAMQSFLSGPFAALFQGASWSTDWSSASSVNTSAEVAPGQTVITSTNANQPGFQELAQAYAMLSEWRLRSQGRRPAGCRHGRLFASFRRCELDDQPSGRARLDPERGHQCHQFHELSAHDPARPDRRSRQRQYDGDRCSDHQSDQPDPDGLRAHLAPAAAQSGAISAGYLIREGLRCTNSLTTK